jgi:hypothetical protein
MKMTASFQAAVKPPERLVPEFISASQGFFDENDGKLSGGGETA